MRKTQYFKEWKQSVQLLGRILKSRDGVLYLGWTNTGIRFQYTGTFLIAGLRGMCGTEQQDPLQPGRKTWPYLSVFLDDAEEPASVFPVNGEKGKYLLFASEEQETHMITICKRTENQTGRVGVTGLYGDGVLKKPEEPESNLCIEFIGDSITCGFGNLSKDPNRMFFTEDEDGWLSHAAIAGRMLHVNTELVCSSGIPLSRGSLGDRWPGTEMIALYSCTDRLTQEYLGEQEWEEWDFQTHKKDIIVVNLGTNDTVVLDQTNDKKEGIMRFEEDYRKFLALLREKNGSSAWIICALGPMDYYLYDNITKAVKDYIQRTGDTRICCFKYGKTLICEGAAPCNHPTVDTQRRMAKEIAEFIRNHILTEREEK